MKMMALQSAARGLALFVMTFVARAVAFAQPVGERSGQITAAEEVGRNANIWGIALGALLVLAVVLGFLALVLFLGRRRHVRELREARY